MLSSSLLTTGPAKTLSLDDYSNTRRLVSGRSTNRKLPKAMGSQRTDDIACFFVASSRSATLVSRNWAMLLGTAWLVLEFKPTHDTFDPAHEEQPDGRASQCTLSLLHLAQAWARRRTLVCSTIAPSSGQMNDSVILSRTARGTDEQRSHRKSIVLLLLRHIALSTSSLHKLYHVLMDQATTPPRVRSARFLS
jgi:hypothetical protein